MISQSDLIDRPDTCKQDCNILSSAVLYVHKTQSKQCDKDAAFDSHQSEANLQGVNNLVGVICT